MRAAAARGLDSCARTAAVLSRCRSRGLTDHVHEERNQRGGKQQDDSRKRVGGQRDRQDGNRNQAANNELGKILGIVRVQRVDTVHRRGRQLGTSLIAQWVVTWLTRILPCASIITPSR